MGLSQELVCGIKGIGFTEPSIIQELSIAPIIQGHHVIAQAQDGLGKTGALGIGILGAIDATQPITQAIILSPTRETTFNTHLLLVNLGHLIPGLRVEGFHSSQNRLYEADVAHSQPHIVVCTPERCLTLVNSGDLRLDSLKIICLDDAGQLLAENSFGQIQDILSHLSPDSTQHIFFSAEYPQSVLRLTEQFMDDIVRINLGDESFSFEGIQQFFIDVVEEQNRSASLFDLFEAFPSQKTLVFANSIRTVKLLKAQFEHRGSSVATLHSGMNQEERDEIMKEFLSGTSQTLISTNLPSTGVDVQQFAFVINYEFPFDAELYLQRVGCRSHAWSKRVVINFVTDQDYDHFQRIMDYLQVTIEEIPQDISSILENLNKEVVGED